MREKVILEDQVQTLRSLMYGQASLRNDTTLTRDRLTEAEKRLVDTNKQIASIATDARRAGLLPGDIRVLNNLSPEIDQFGANSKKDTTRDRRNSNVKFIEDKDNPNRSKAADWK